MGCTLPGVIWEPPYDAGVHFEARSTLERALGAKVLAAEAVTGGFSGSHCWSVEFADGRSAFVKVATDAETTASNRKEATVLGAVTSRHLPSLIGAFDDERILVVEDLRVADWTTCPSRLDELWEAIEEIGSHAGPDALWQSYQGSGRDSWSAVGSDARFSEAVGLEPSWLGRHLTELAAASQQADTSGDRLLHGDLAPGNWCYDMAGTWRFVDWAAAHRGNSIIDEVIASVRLTRLFGSPVRSSNVADHPELVAFIGGRLANELLDVDWMVAPPQARRDRVADVRSSLVLSADLLDLPAPSFNPEHSMARPERPPTR